METILYVLDRLLGGLSGAFLYPLKSLLIGIIILPIVSFVGIGFAITTLTLPLFLALNLAYLDYTIPSNYYQRTPQAILGFFSGFFIGLALMVVLLAVTVLVLPLLTVMITTAMVVDVLYNFIHGLSLGLSKGFFYVLQEIFTTLNHSSINLISGQALEPQKQTVDSDIKPVSKEIADASFKNNIPPQSERDCIEKTPLFEKIYQSDGSSSVQPLKENELERARKNPELQDHLLHYENLTKQLASLQTYAKEKKTTNYTSAPLNSREYDFDLGLIDRNNLVLLKKYYLNEREEWIAIPDDSSESNKLITDSQKIKKYLNSEGRFQGSLRFIPQWHTKKELMTPTPYTDNETGITYSYTRYQVEISGQQLAEELVKVRDLIRNKLLPQLPTKGLHQYSVFSASSAESSSNSSPDLVKDEKVSPSVKASK